MSQVRIKGPSRELYDATASRVMGLQESYLAGRAGGIRELAQLRHVDAASPAADPTLWALTLGGLPASLIGHGDGPARAEYAIHAALVLYAVHQQSQQRAMHRAGVGLGAAVRQVARSRAVGGEWDNGTVSRFESLCRAQSHDVRVRQLRGLVTLMRGEGVAMDYGRLAQDLYRLQAHSNDSGVLLRWGRDLHRQAAPTGASSSSSTSTNSSTIEQEN